MATLLAVCAVTAAILLGGGLARASGADASAPRDAEAVEMGTLDLSSRPSGVEIVVDDQKTGVRTPGTVPLSAGQHHLTLRSPNPKEFKDRSLWITIVAGKPTRMTLELAPVPALR
jgi:hypothetical protein